MTGRRVTSGCGRLAHECRQVRSPFDRDVGDGLRGGHGAVGRAGVRPGFGRDRAVAPGLGAAKSLAAS
jgi:hypothetical protein